MPNAVLRVLAISASAATLAACATPHARYAIDGGPHGGPRVGPQAGRSEGSRRQPRIDPELRGTMKPYQVGGIWYTPRQQPGYDETGVASWYGQQFHNRSTADGETFDMDALSAAHKTLPLPSMVEVTNLDNGKKLVVRVNDRGPFVDGRIIDLSRGAAEKLGFADQGVTRVRVRYLGPADGPPVGRQVAALAPSKTPAAPVAPARIVGVRGPIWTVQAAAFSSRTGAERAAGQFANARVEAMDRGGVTLWRVMLGPIDTVEGADALRDQAAAAGFDDATVLGPL